MKFDDNVINKIKIFLETERGNKLPIFDKDVAEELGISPTNLSMMKKRDILPVEEIMMFCGKKRLNINWILLNQIPDSLNEETDRLIDIKYFGDINASAGGGAFNEQDEYRTIAYPSYILASLGYKKHLKNIEIINVSGDSMEPELSNGDKIFIDRNKVIPNNKDMFVVQSPDGIFVKRLKNVDANTMELVSSNDVYPNESVNINDLGIVGKVILKLENL